MANVRCPMCSKLNPPEAEVCSYCGARLKPLRGGPPAGSSKNDEPDWLKQLRSDDSGSLPKEEAQGKPAESSPASEADLPDWLARIRDRARTETGGPEKEEEPDWMKNLQGETPADQGLDDWLSRLPGGQDSEPGSAKPTNQPEQPSSGAENAALPGPELEPPDWLRSLSDENLNAGQETGGNPAFDLESPASPDSSATGEEDWMSKLSAWQTGSTEGSAAPSDQASFPAAGDEFSWLENLDNKGSSEKGPSEEGPSEQPGPESSPGTGLTGFLKELEEPQSAAGNEPPAAPTQEGSAEWSGPEAEKGSTSPFAGFGLTGFLSGLNEQGGTQEPAAPQGENPFPGLDQAPGTAPEKSVPDWLKGLENETPAQPAAGAAFAEPQMPDWLKGISEEQSSQPAAPAEPEAGEPALPDWLSSTAETPAQPAAEPFVGSTGQPGTDQSDLPDWLLGAGEPTAAPEASVSEPAPAEEPATSAGGQEENLPAAGLPDWLSGDLAAPQPQEAPAAEEIPAAPPSGEADNLPDWFASFEQGEVEKTQPSRVTGGLKPAAEQVPPAPAAPEEQPAQAGAAEEGQMPDWLREFQGQAAEPMDADAASVFGDEITPETEFAEQAAAGEGEQPFTVDLPEWLGEEAPTGPVETCEPAAEPSGEQLTRVDLPEWVKEMRPIESILPSEAPQVEADQRVEKAGPLAGMRGVLPVEETAARYRKLPTYSVKLHTTEKQRTQGSLLESILSQEAQPLLIPPERSRATGVLVRVLVALFFLLVLAAPFFGFGILATPAAELFPAENQMYQKINERLQSSPNAPVLLAIEYEPALSGEMRLAASGVVNQLIAKNARIVLVSTVPAGPALGQQLISDAAANQKGYQLSTQMVNLGYLPGGVISLVSFVQDPKRTAPATIGYQPAWGDKTFLKSVSGLADFSQVIVLTDRAEVGRTWVEQVQPLLGNVPLLVVASAQAAPLLQPYSESGQIAGMTSGLLGGVVYAEKAGQSSPNQLNYLSAYQVGVTLALVVVLVGGIISGGMSLLKRGDKDEA